MQAVIDVQRAQREPVGRASCASAASSAVESGAATEGDAQRNAAESRQQRAQLRAPSHAGQNAGGARVTHARSGGVRKTRRSGDLSARCGAQLLARDRVELVEVADRAPP